MAFVIVDTDILVDAGRGDNDAIVCLQSTLYLLERQTDAALQVYEARVCAQGV